jgi:hypothetical protein
MKGEQPIMNAKFLLVAGLLAAAMLPACVGPPKVMVNHGFRGDDKTSKLLIMNSGQIDPSTKKQLFNVFVRMCDINAQGIEATCVDTKIVENVVPGTVY